jgi:molecular chaperone GrpE
MTTRQNPQPDKDPPDQRDQEQSEAEEDARAAERSKAELEDRWLRAAAELDNVRKRHARELERARAEERRRVAAAWLPTLDNLDAALAHADADPGAIVAGVRTVRDQAVRILADLGYPRDDDIGVPFDPHRHEVVSVVDDADADPGTVVRILRPGYGETGQQLRPAAVAVTRNPE